MLSVLENSFSTLPDAKRIVVLLFLSE